MARVPGVARCESVETGAGPLLEVREVTKSYGAQVTALRAVSLRFWPGESVAIVGRSGSGKSTLLSILGLLDEPTSGEVLVDGVGIDSKRDRDRSSLRATKFGFVFQRSHLIGELTSEENVALSLSYAGWDPADLRDRSLDALVSVGLEERLGSRARTLSGGEMQRVAVARAFARAPRIWLADEPTGNLDSAQSEEVVDLLAARAKEHGAALIMVTHEPDLAERMDRVVTLQDGQVVSDIARHQATGGGDGQRAGSGNEGGSDSRRTGLVWRVRRSAGFTLQTLNAQPRRGVAGIAAAALAVALTVVALGLGQSASAQVSARFDSLRAQEVSARYTMLDENGPLDATGESVVPGPTVTGQLREYPGVLAAELWNWWEAIPAVNGQVAATTTSVVSVTGDQFVATRTDVDWATQRHRLAPGEVIIGKLLAKRLHVGQIDLMPEIEVAGDRYRVVGLITDSKITLALGAAFVGPSYGPGLGAAPSGEVSVTTAPGAAHGVAENLTKLVDPFDTSDLTVNPVLRADTYRESLQSGISASLGILSMVAVVAGLIAVAAINVLNVGARTAEFGVRRAFGSTRGEIAMLVIGETTLLSAIGSLLGVSIGFSAIMIVTAAARWSPVFDQRLVLAGIAGAAVFGLIGGLAPAISASRVEPAEAVRS
jgi:macrolide transport system ATP-binding/permease protein